jgi:hypothetical protein
MHVLAHLQHENVPSAYTSGGAWSVESSGGVFCPSPIVVVDLPVKVDRSREGKIAILCNRGDVFQEIREYIELLLTAHDG